MHILNAEEPIEVTELGIVIDVKLLQPWNAFDPIELTFDCIVSVTKFLQLVNAHLPIVSNESPKAIDFKQLHP